MMERDTNVKRQSREEEARDRDTGSSKCKDRSLTSRLSLGDGGIGVCLAGVLPDAVTATLLIGRLVDVFRLRARTTAPIALEAETAGARSGRSRSLFHYCGRQ